MEITAKMETKIEIVAAVVTNSEDRQDAEQELRLKLLNQTEMIKTDKILFKFLKNRLYWFLIANKAQGLTFNGSPTQYELQSDYTLPRPEYIEFPKQLAAYNAINLKKRRKLIIWIIEQWIKQC